MMMMPHVIHLHINSKRETSKFVGTLGQPDEKPPSMMEAIANVDDAMVR